jgi:protein-tyrosine phosphatase
MQQGLAHRIEVDSCGTGDWHVGSAPDRRAALEAQQRGYDLSQLRARQLRSQDFARFDYILAMDDMNLAELNTMCPEHYPGHLGLFLPFAPGSATDEVPDPYYGGDRGFAEVLDLVEAASQGLLQAICEEKGLRHAHPPE